MKSINFHSRNIVEVMNAELQSLVLFNKSINIIVAMTYFSKIIPRLVNFPKIIQIMDYSSTVLILPSSQHDSK